MKKILIVFVLAVSAGTAFFFYSNRQEVQAVKEPITIDVPTPTPTPTPASSVTEVHSADGEMKLVMRKEGASPLYFSFFASDMRSSGHLIFTKSTTDSEFLLPANSWSPDNKYFFIEENRATSSSYLVFKATGENFVDGSNYLDVSSLFAAKVPDYVLREVTGWDAPGLLHVLTNGPSFWFDIGSKAFLQLATK